MQIFIGHMKIARMVCILTGYGRAKAVPISPPKSNILSSVKYFFTLIFS
jgi:hypothetical protein